MGIPQIILLALYSISFGIALANNGEQGPEVSARRTFIGILIEMTILYYGGFWG